MNASKKQNIAVVGAGPAGLSFAVTAAQRGHNVTLFDKDNKIGGQFNMAKMVPGKEEFYETLRYFNKQIQLTGVHLQLNTNVTPEMLNGKYDSVVVATGVLPRQINLKKTADSNVNVYSYVDVLRNNVSVGKRVAVIGAGGIGYDISDFLTHEHHYNHQKLHENTTKSVLADQLDASAIQKFLDDWGIDKSIAKGGLNKETKPMTSPRKIYLLQRKKGKLGSTLGKTTGWIHRTTMKMRGVEEISGCKYIEVNNKGLVIQRGEELQTLEVDTVVVCAGQESLNDLFTALKSGKSNVFLIGGAHEAGELDAKRAIDQGTRLAAVIETAKTGDVYEQPIDLNYKIMKKVQEFVGKK